ncbi:MAG: nitrile hydratase accessory protein [Pseudomonadota bacterium]
MNRSKPSCPPDADFAEPWQSEAMALSAAIQEAGLLSPAEWSKALSAEIERARAEGDPPDGTTHHDHVLAALERLVTEKGLLSDAAIRRRRRDWEAAYQHTPHGEPVVLATESAAD